MPSRKPLRRHRKTCRICGRIFHSNRFDAVACSTRCRVAKSKGGDLAYLSDWPKDRAQARRFVHEADQGGIATERALRDQKRALKAFERTKVHLHLETNPEPPSTRQKPRGAGKFIDI